MKQKKHSMETNSDKRLEALENAAWGAWATQAEKEGFIGADASDEMLKKVLGFKPLGTLSA